MRRRVVAAVAVAAVAALGATALLVSRSAEPADADRAWGVVVDETGQPVVGAALALEGGERVVTDDRGEYEVALSAPALATASAPDHLDRAQALSPGHGARITLARQDGATVSLRFGGDVMAGRRFFEAANGQQPLLRPDSGAADHAALLSAVEPLLTDSDLTVVNLETALMDDPVVPPGPRPERFHPTKELVIASLPALAEGLASAGVDVVALGNNHVNDGLAAGIDRTLQALDQAGIAHVGAGRTVDEAWQPVVVERRGQRVGFVSCTTVNGFQHPIPYVATPTQGGAAYCEESRIVGTLAGLSGRTDERIVMIHGDVEYQRVQGPLIQGLIKAAADAGATAVIVSHPHVIGGVTEQGSMPVAETTGNLLFDQDLWDTFPSYLVRVDVRGGRAIHTGVDPIALDDYRPRPTVGRLAATSARIAAGTVASPTLLGGSGAVLGSAPPPTAARRITLRPGQPARVPAGWTIDAMAPVRRGADLLFGTGSFDPADTDATTVGARLWDLGRYADVSPDAACSSSVGIRLRRSPVSEKDVLATIDHRAPVVPGQQVSLLVDVRAASAGASAEIRWYSGPTGASSGTAELPIEPQRHAANTCRTIRLDATVPAGVVAAQPYIRLKPPNDAQQSARLLVDNVVLAAWDPALDPKRVDVVESPNGGAVAAFTDPEPARRP